MTDKPDIVPLSDLLEDAVSVLARLHDSGKPIVLTRDGRSSAVLVRPDDYERSRHELALLKSIAQGEMELARGEGIDMEDILAKADELLSARA